jgi:2-polyprenyl-3-methyl-5-hydroxy-6-metoxy-1,4-benzoquinol methylase
VNLLTADQNAAYWEDRHRQQGDLRSGGHISYDEPTNRMFYTRRLSMLLDFLGHQSDPKEPLFLLDAGCGKGWFSRELAAFGHQVDGIDGSEHAIAQCRERGGGPRYAVSTLSGWRSPWLYDAVLSVDVMFHILDDGEWERTVRNLASLVRLGGRLIISDWGAAEDRPHGNYMVTRGRPRYEALFEALGLRNDGWHSFAFRNSPMGFHVYTRVR